MADKIKVVSPDGQPGEIPAAQVGAAQDQGFRVLTPEVQAELDRHEKLGGVGGIAKSVLAGVARGATLGLSDLALTKGVVGAGGETIKGGLVDAQTLKDLEDENPTASTVGEVAGSVLPVVGELGLGAKAGKAVGSEVLGAASDAALRATPTGLVTALGEGTEAALSKALGNQIAGKIAGATVRGAVEGELYNIGSNISEAALGDENITAERLLAHSEDALLLGGGLGFGVTAGGIAMRAAAEKASGALNGLADTIKDRFPMANPETLNNYAEATAGKVGMEPDDVKKLFTGIGTEEGQKLRASIGTNDFLTPEERNEMGLRFKSALDDARNAVDETKDKAFREMRPKEISTLVKDMDTQVASESAFKLADDMRATIKRMRDDPDIFSQTGLIKTLEKAADGYEKRLLSVESAEDLFNLVNGTKQNLDKQMKIFGKDIRPEMRATVDLAKEVRDSFKSHLTNEEIWGQAAARQSAFNDAFSALATAERNLIGKDGKLGAFGVKVNTKNGGVKLELSPKKINTFLSQTGAARSEAQETALREYLEAAQAFTKQVENTGQHAEMAFDRAGVDSLLEKSKSISAEAEKKLAFESQVRQAARLDDIGMNMFPATAAMAMSAAAKTIPGAAAVMGAAGAIKQGMNMRNNPIALAKTLARVEGFALGPAKQISKAIDTMIAKAEPAATGAAKRAIGETTRQIIEPPKEDSLSRFRRQQKELAANAAAGQAHALQLQAGFSQLSDHAPKTMQALVSKQLQVNDFLLSKMPKDPFAAGATNPAAKFWRPSDTQLSQFQRYNRAATNPMSVIQDAAKGMVTPEGVETLKTLYPSLYGDFQRQMFDRVSATGKPMPYNSAVALSLLFGVPLVAVMKPEVRAALQANFADKKDEEAPQDKMPNIPRGESKIGSSMRTDEQRREER